MMGRDFFFLCLVTCLHLSTSAELSEEQIKRLTSMPGHMKPFGSAGPYFDLPVIEGFPKPRDFFNKYVIPSTPVIMRNAAKISPAFTKWTEEYFLTHPGSEKALIFAEGRKKEIRTEPGETMSFKKFVERYNHTDMYMVNSVPIHIRGDVILPPPLQCKPVIPHLADTVMWYSSGGTISVLHNDDVDNINCLYRGSKRLIFVNPHDTNVTWVQHIIDRPSGGYSSMDVDAVDYTQFPDLADVRYARVDMTAGDCLFIPFRWFHQVNSFGDSNLAVNLWWNHQTDIFLDMNDEICGDYTGKNTLADFKYNGMEDSDSEGGDGIVGAGVAEVDETAQENQEGDEELPEEDQSEEGDQEEGGGGPYAQQPESSLDRIYAAVARRKKPVKMDGIKRFFMKLMPDNIKNWDDQCQAILVEFYGMLDQNKDTLITVEDSNIFEQLDDKTYEQFAEAASYFEEAMRLSMQEATVKKEKDLVLKLLERGELDREQIATIFGNKMFSAGLGRDEL